MLNLTDISHNQKENKIINLKKICYNNKKLKFMPIIKDLKHVEILFLNDNEISTLSFCQDLPNLKEIEYLSFCKKLHTIYLKGNPIQIKNNQIYVQKIKKVVISIKNIDGTKIFQDKKLNLYYFLKNSSKKKQLKRFNNDLLLKNIKPSIITDNTNSTATNNIRIYKRKASGYKDYNSVDHTDKINHHMKLKKYNNGKKLWNYVNFNDTIKKDIERTERRRKSDFGTIRRMIDKCNENTCVNNLNVISNEDNKEEITNSNVLSSVNVLLNGLNLVQLKQLQNYVNKKLSITKLNIYNE